MTIDNPVYTAELKVKGTPADIMDLFSTELSRKYNRASVSVRDEGDSVVFEVRAKDSVALRAHLLGLTKMLTVHEQMTMVK